MSHQEDAVLLALITHREKGVSVPAVVAEVLACNNIDEVWLSQHPADLFGGRDDSLVTEAQRQLAAWSDAGLHYVSILDSNYPRRLRAVHDAPPFLFYRGSLKALTEGGISVVGSREASERGISRAQEVTRHLVREQIPVISGLARGIDAAAHQSTLDAGGSPLGVIATGINAPYTPAATRDLHERVASAGALVSQFMPEAHAMRHTFLQRNATMSGLGLATFVVEAGEISGARAQARLAMQHGRPVILTDMVARRTNWGRELADGLRRNVYVVSSLQESAEAIRQVQAMTSLETLDRVLLMT